MIIFYAFFATIETERINSKQNCKEINREFKSKNCTKRFERYSVIPFGKRWKQEFNVTGAKVLWEEAMLTDCPVVQADFPMPRVLIKSVNDRILLLGISCLFHSNFNIKPLLVKCVTQASLYGKKLQ